MAGTRQKLHDFFADDLANKEQSGSCMSVSKVNESFARCTNELATLLRDTDYPDGPRSGDRWEVVYHRTSLTSGTIQLVDNGEHEDPSQRFGLSVRDMSCKFLFTEAALKSWVTNAFCDAVCVPVGRKKARDGADRDMCVKQIPWRRITIVHSASVRNLNQVLSQYKSYAEKRAAPPKRKRLGATSTDPPAKRQAVAAVVREPVVDTPPREDDPDDEGPAQNAADSTDPNEDDPGDIPNPDRSLREVSEDPCKLAELLAVQRELTAELAKERAVRQGLETRVTCMQVELQKTMAVMRSMEIEMTGLHRFLEEGAKAACRIATAYGPNARASMAAP